jgi:hypothetical protein
MSVMMMMMMVIMMMMMMPSRGSKATENPPAPSAHPMGTSSGVSSLFATCTTPLSLLRGGGTWSSRGDRGILGVWMMDHRR